MKTSPLRMNPGTEETPLSSQRSPKTIEINPASCLCTNLWQGNPGESITIEIDGLWMKVTGGCNIEWNGPEFVDLVLVLKEPESGEFHQIGPIRYSGSPMKFGPYDFRVTLTARVHCDYISANHQNCGDPLRATVRYHQRQNRTNRHPQALKGDEAA